MGGQPCLKSHFILHATIYRVLKTVSYIVPNAKTCQRKKRSCKKEEKKGQLTFHKIIIPNQALTEAQHSPSSALFTRLDTMTINSSFLISSIKRLHTMIYFTDIVGTVWPWTALQRTTWSVTFSKNSYTKWLISYTK